MPAEIENGARVVESFLQTLMAQGYVPESIAAYRKRCRHFIVWLYLHDVALAEVDDDVFSRFLLHDCTCAHPHFFIRSGRFAGRNNSRSKIGLFIEYLIGTGIAPPRPTPACEEPGHYLARFLVWLRRYRGIGDGTIQSYHKAMRVLLPHLGDDPDRYSATLIRNTVRCRLETASRELVRRETSALRLYLRFLALDGLCRPGLVGAVPTVPQQRFSTLPRHLPRDDIEHIIASCDLATPMGLRDRAIVLLLARLALRAGDVANLRLNDIDWDNAVVRVSGKSRRAAVLPLPQDVGAAVKDYILHARPVVDAEKVFLRMMPPLHRPLASGGVSAVAQAAIKRSGVKAQGLPAGHVFRHSAATNLLRDNTPLEVISKRMKRLLLGACHQVSKRDDKMLTPSEYKALQKRYRTILTQGARELPPIPPRQNGQRGKVAKSDAHNLWERMQKHETAVLRFAKHPDVAFTNNRAERDLRMAKVKQKVSGCFRTRKYAQAYCRISSYLQSMANQGYNPWWPFRSLSPGVPLITWVSS